MSSLVCIYMCVLNILNGFPEDKKCKTKFNNASMAIEIPSGG